MLGIYTKPQAVDKIAPQWLIMGLLNLTSQFIQHTSVKNTQIYF